MDSVAAVKKCSKCGKVKLLSEFSPNGNGYLKARCKPCKSKDVCDAYTKKTPEQRKAQMVRISAWAKANPQKYRSYAKTWRRRSKDVVNLRTQLRRKRVRHAIPKWAEQEAIRALYREAALRTKTTGVPHEVDHIVPLRSSLVCGLHWEGNLRVIPRSENRKKNNWQWPDMPVAAAPQP